MENLLESAAATATPTASRPTTMSVGEFCKSQGLTQIVPKIRVNSNGYPYVTFINGENVATNIYFTVNASDTVSEGQDLREISDDLQIVFVQNADGEDRIKLSRKSTSRLSVEDLF